MTKVPMVTLCDVLECGFNVDKKCRAAAIQVGDEPTALQERLGTQLQDPQCDTFTRRPGALFGAEDFHGQVGACKVDSCTHNAQLTCRADAIVVGMHASHADCQTFKLRA